jgi:hypothetical protein
LIFEFLAPVTYTQSPNFAYKPMLNSCASVGTIPARMLGRFQPLLANIYFYETDTLRQSWGRIPISYETTLKFRHHLTDASSLLEFELGNGIHNCATGSFSREAFIMTPVLQEVLAANEAYAASFGDKGKLAMPPARRFAILTCMDARLDPAKYAGLAEGDAHVIRNAGGRATDDAIRSLVHHKNRVIIFCPPPINTRKIRETNFALFYRVHANRSQAFPLT